MNSEKYIGLDVHQATISVAVMDYYVNGIQVSARVAASLLGMGAANNIGSMSPTGFNTGADGNSYAYTITASSLGMGYNYFGVDYGTARFELGLPTDINAITISPMQTLAQAKAFAKRLLKHRKCDNGYGGGGVGARRMDATTYTIKSANAHTGSWSMMTTGWNSVDINRQTAFPSGGYFQGQNGWKISFSDVVGYVAFELLHELAHQMDDITGAVPDGDVDPALMQQHQEQNDQWVYDHCLTP